MGTRSLHKRSTFLAALNITGQRENLHGRSSNRKGRYFTLIQMFQSECEMLASQRSIYPVKRSGDLARGSAPALAVILGARVDSMCRDQQAACQQLSRSALDTLYPQLRRNKEYVGTACSLMF